MSTTIQETINRLRELDRYASPAPWRVGITESGGHGILCEYVASVEVVIDTLWEGEPMDDSSPDLEIITETRNALPVLLAEIDRLQKSEKALKNRFARTFNKWRARRPELIRKERLEAWNEGYKYGQLSGIKTQRVGHVHPYKNPYEK